MKTVVCHMTSAHPAHDIRIFHKQCASLVKNGYDVHLVAAGSLSPDNKGVIHHALPVRSRGGRLGRMIVRAWHTYRMARRTGADLFHFHDPELLPWGLLLKWQGKVVVYDAHEDLPRDILTKAWIPGSIRTLVARTAECLEHFVARRLDRVVAATPFIRIRFQSVGAQATDIKNYPVIDELDYPAAPTAESPLPALCYVGTLSPQRGILTMLKAIETLPVRLIIAGSFVDQKTEAEARALPGWAKVDYRGVVSRSEVARILAESAVGLCLLHHSPTHNESLPIKLFEYMSAGLAVLSSDIPLWQDIVERSDCGLSVDPVNIEAIRQRIIWMLENPQEARQMGQNGRMAVRERYSWEAEASRLAEAYREVLND
ncbi:glycosyltransferase family 4 protein [Legionella sp. CNM-4043-24]|uniref:glycosyltransferase family 4 protein n=1 Tax=Legionella sp. CNM-4043-24 TaxID=3421646 RepID=UPI00403AFCD3